MSLVRMDNDTNSGIVVQADKSLKYVKAWPGWQLDIFLFEGETFVHFSWNLASSLVLLLLVILWTYSPEIFVTWLESDL